MACLRTNVPIYVETKYLHRGYNIYVLCTIGVVYDLKDAGTIGDRVLLKSVRLVTWLLIFKKIIYIITAL